MRLGASREGFWLSFGPGRWELHPWGTLWPFVLLPVLLVGVLVLATNRESRLLPVLRNALRGDDAASVADSLEIFAAHNRTALENALFCPDPPTTSALPVVELYVAKNTLREMQESKRRGDPELGHDPGGDTPYHRCLMRDEQGQLMDSKLAYRGSFGWHHWPVKPSLRVRIKKSEVKIGHRYVELSRPKDVLALRHRLPEMLGADLGLLTARTDVVRLLVNRHFQGVYQRSWRAGEPLALAHGRMPGTFFKGDAVREHRRDNLWETVQHWRRFGEDSEADVQHFERFLALLRAPVDGLAWQQFEELFDTEVYARWAAVMSLTGCIHTDRHHNHMYFLCSNQGKLEAMPWDPTCYETAEGPFAPIDSVRHPVMAFATRNPVWVHRRNEWLWQLLHGLGSVASLHERIDAEMARLRPDLEADTQLSDLVFRLYRMPASTLEIDERYAALRSWVEVKHERVRRYLEEARVTVTADAKDPGVSHVAVHGHVAVVARQGDRERLLYPGLSEELLSHHFAPSSQGVEVLYARSAPLVYRLEVPAAELAFRNALTGAAVTPGARAAGSEVAVRSLHPWDLPEAPTGEVRLGPGRVELTQDLHVGPQQVLIVEPGTEIVLAAGVGIYARGRTEVRGTRQAPVVLVPADAEPWAAFAVHGPETGGSRFEFLEVRGGSIGRDGGTRFKGMFNVYGCPDVVLRHCRFAANLVGDDAVNLAESRILVEDCEWRDARADALDADRCRGTVRRCRFVDSGNDALDLMTCRLVVSDCTFESSGDKGVSVGEETFALIEDCTMVNGSLGMELKDASRAVVRRCHFDGNRIGLHAYQKKWVYGRGGAAFLEECQLEGNLEADFDIEGRSSLHLRETPTGSVSRGAGRILEVDAMDSAFVAVLELLEAQP